MIQLRLTATLIAALFALGLTSDRAVAQSSGGPLRIEITEGVIEPLPIAIAPFLVGAGASPELAKQVAQVVADDLERSGLFRTISPNAFISPITSFDSPVQYADWKAINAQALVTGEVSKSGDRVSVKFRLFDIFSENQMGDGLQFGGSAASTRRLGHKVADQVYSRITGEGPYFDSRVVFVSESGPKNARLKRLAVMDYDGANVSYLTNSDDLVLAPRISATGDQVLYTSYASGFPRIRILDTATLQQRSLDDQPGQMTFSPRFSPDGRTVLFSLSDGGNTDLYTLDLASGKRTRLTSAPSIETAPSYSPDGRQIVFESDRSGSQQLYIMPATGGEATRISFGQGRYGTPVWSPRGDLVAFTKQNQGRFHIGVMRIDGSEERLLTASFLDEGPSWAPNGRVVMFSRETAGASGGSSLYSVDITGRNLARVPTPEAASDPAWSPLLP
ncbi:Tol-Pal system beta propeller repeat protein TolB [Pseudoruegeria sp. SK021]|uniref:Tol-Pal system beta propeller repeat protein TolB n=1 Tax=Pseudoruegeria sp. SK021 TaxID=1933035 RepID=UPI000A223E7B|nr:Tol-Pal system beta propeller repeat protein TolB [Pseudoruegeria sp. SK021]OSP56534.1 Tol-Pal system beta propeller repeat protein TolB [Pseudoruegeria sp. SK021]